MLRESGLNSNTTNVKVKRKGKCQQCFRIIYTIQIQPMLRLNSFITSPSNITSDIQIQPMLRLNIL